MAGNALTGSFIESLWPAHACVVKRFGAGESGYDDRNFIRDWRYPVTINWNLPWDGECRCGQLRIRVSAPPILTAACHCTGCQRMSASAYSLTALIPHSGFAVTRGDPVIGGLHGAHRHFFCPHCLSWVFTRPQGIDQFVNVRPTMLGDVSWFVPFIETYTSEKLPWATTPAVHRFEKFPPMTDLAGLVAEYAVHVSNESR